MGAPKKNRIDVLRTRLWCSVVRANSGLTARQIGNRLPGSNQETADGVDRKSTWPKYESGERIPRIGKPPFSVEQADKLWPGTCAYFEAPIWDALKGSVQNYPGSEVVDCLKQYNGANALPIEQDGNVFRVDTGGLLRVLARDGSFAALALGCLLIAALGPKRIARPECGLDLGRLMDFQLHDDCIPARIRAELMDAVRAWANTSAEEWRVSEFLLRLGVPLREDELRMHLENRSNPDARMT